MNSDNGAVKGSISGGKFKPAFFSDRLLEQVGERLRYLHYSLKTEQAHFCPTRFACRTTIRDF